MKCQQSLLKFVGKRQHTTEFSATTAADAAINIGTRTRAPSAELVVLIAKI